MITAIIIVGSLSYASVALACARLLAGHLAWRWSELRRIRYAYRTDVLEPSGDDWIAGWCLGLLVMVAWPLCLLYAAPYFLSRRYAVGAEREAKLRAREARIAKLEKDAGIQ